jgi:glycosyltransferase involved in cell wall biosynthesis
MRIGFSLDYQQNDPTHMSIRLAQLVSDLGCDAELYSRERAGKVHPYWDRFVSKDKRGQFEEWVASGIDVLIYTHLPHWQEVRYVRSRKVRTILLALWDMMDPNNMESLPLFHQIVCPGKSVIQLLRHQVKLDNFTLIPWDSGIPITFEPRKVTSDRIGVIWPLEWQQAKRQDPQFLAVAEKLVADCPNVWLTISYSGTIPGGLLRDIRNVVNLSNGRVELMKSISLERQELLYGHHDLTVWPSLRESVPLVGLMSLSMGTPLIAFDHPAIADVVRDAGNGVLVPCELDLVGIGGSQVNPDYELFTKRLCELVRNVAMLDHLRQNSVNGLRERRDVFISRWKQLLVQ